MGAIAPPVCIELRGRFEPAEEFRYRHVPFEVPAGLRQLQIEIEYNERIHSAPLIGRGNTLDIGLFDERGIEAGGAGFRGWSGSERVSITIDEAWATPPYKAGPIGAGRWHLLLGPYKIGRSGLDYRVTITLDPGLPRELPALTRPWPAARTVGPAARPGWVRGDLHCHSLYSDGDSWPEELVYAAAERGLDFIAVTDHNGAVRPRIPEADGVVLPLLIPGIEVTTYRGHWNVWGTDGWFDFREQSAETVRAEMTRATASGGLVSINHPKPWGPEWVYDGVEPAAAAMEVWNGPWEWLNVICLAEWEERLIAGHRLTAVGGSDAHHLRPLTFVAPIRPSILGEPTTWVHIEGALSIASILDGIRAGRCFVSVSPEGPQLYLDRDEDAVSIEVVDGDGATLEVITGGEIVGSFPVTGPSWRNDVPFPSGKPYLRAQLTNGGDQMLAVSNPVWADSGD